MYNDVDASFHWPLGNEKLAGVNCFETIQSTPLPSRGRVRAGPRLASRARVNAPLIYYPQNMFVDVVEGAQGRGAAALSPDSRLSLGHIPPRG